MKSKLINLFTLSLISFVLSGCASISKEECLTGDWNNIGYRDGMAGKPLSRVQNYIQDCGKAGATVDRAQYEAGRNEGLKTYCTKENGFLVGKGGGSQFSECPPTLSSGFNAGWAVGRKLYDIQNKINVINGEIKTIEKDMEKPEVTPRERSLMRDRIRDKERQINDLNRDLIRAEMEAEREMGAAATRR